MNKHNGQDFNTFLDEQDIDTESAVVKEATKIIKKQQQKIVKLEAELKELKKRIEEYREFYGEEIVSDIEEENKKLRECVEFYADRQSWNGRLISFQDSEILSMQDSRYVKNKGGKRARQCLKEIKGE